MGEFIFTSPGYKFKERDLTFVTRNVGVTTLGLVGETLKGPAFEPIFIEDKKQFETRFGKQSPIKWNGEYKKDELQYQLPYVANAYLEESNQLWVTRVLGLSGYDAGPAWLITLSAGVDPNTINSVDGSAFDANFTNNEYMGVKLYSLGDSGYTFTGFIKTSPTQFSGTGYTFTVTSIDGNGDGIVNVIPTVKTGSPYTEYENMVLAVIRSRANVVDRINSTPLTEFKTTTVTINNNTTLLDTGDLLGRFKISASDGTTTEEYEVSLNPNDSSYLPNVIGSAPKDKNTKIWVQSIYPDLIKKLDADELGFGINTYVIKTTTNSFSDWKQPFQTPETPWVVSQLMGSQIYRLFKFISISDGDSANQEIKISILNINPVTNEFDVYIRDFNDTDENPIILESYTKCTLIPEQNSFIGRKIGTIDGEYALVSNYVMVELDDNIPEGAFPAGFEGYLFNDYSSIATGDNTISGIAPKIFYKKSYTDTEINKLNKYYLGISEHGYDSNNLVGGGINQNFFNYNGDPSVGHIKTKGFHMDSGATSTYTNGNVVIGEFETGVARFRDISDISNINNPYYKSNARKFTLVPAGGFDGWNVHRGFRSNLDGYQQGGIYSGLPGQPNVQPKNDYQAWQTAIKTFANPEEVTINLLATPGIDWSNNSILVKEVIEMVEKQRTDCLYIIDSPDETISITDNSNELVSPDVLAARAIASALEDTEIDSNYSCTYFPWIQIRDSVNNVNVYIPPTCEVVKAIAYTDKVKFPWFAPAGLNRGVINARKSKYKLTQEARDILYAARINPIADFTNVGTAIFGQKTLQKKETALNRINVRRLLLQIKVLISNISVRLLFEQNDQAIINEFLSKANPVLETIKRERGLVDFRIKMDDTNNTPETRDRNELYGEIYIKPTRSLEYIGITFTITPSGASFSDVGA